MSVYSRIIAPPSLWSSSIFSFSFPRHLVSREDVMKKVRRATQKQALAAVRTNPTSTDIIPPEKSNDFLFIPYMEMSTGRPRAVAHRTGEADVPPSLFSSHEMAAERLRTHTADHSHLLAIPQVFRAQTCIDLGTKYLGPRPDLGAATLEPNLYRYRCALFRITLSPWKHHN